MDHANIPAQRSLHGVEVLLVARPPPDPVPGGSVAATHGSWLLAIPPGFGLFFWIRLVFANTKAIGLSQRVAIDASNGVPVFPQDFPETEAYETQSRRLFQEKANEWLARPSSKRINWDRMHVAHPFVTNWAALQTPELATATKPLKGKQSKPERRRAQERWAQLPADFPETIHTCPVTILRQRASVLAALKQPPTGFALLQVHLRFPLGGRPEWNAHIYALQVEDCEAFIAVAKRRKPQADPVECDESETNKGHKRPAEDRAGWPSYLGGMGKASELVDTKSLARKQKDLIGFVTSGCFSRQLGQGLAIGFCSVSGTKLARSIEGIPQSALSAQCRFLGNADAVVMVRNVDSPTFCFAGLHFPRQ
eukprot:TRINITY_DN21607_c0_g1_i1.p1 TRINITY_DN21607_c0_g1~~TRINITY_DN21607_c0_g1_i1.p1  ORF type:complete len:366 (+),score=43.17 TRINITY_DN21607_c0_g1_i1:1188-2285(+)